MCETVVGPFDLLDSSWFTVFFGRLYGILPELVSMKASIDALVSATSRPWLNWTKGGGSSGTRM